MSTLKPTRKKLNDVHFLTGHESSVFNVKDSVVSATVKPERKRISKFVTVKRNEYTMSSYNWSRKRVKLKFGTDWAVMCFIILSIFGQVSEECPVSCECKWKSGKESVVCQDPERKLERIPTGLDSGTQVSVKTFE